MLRKPRVAAGDRHNKKKKGIVIMDDKAHSPLRQFGAFAPRVFIPAFESADPEVIAFMLGHDVSNQSALQDYRVHCREWLEKKVVVKVNQQHETFRHYKVARELSSAFRHDTLLDLNDLDFQPVVQDGKDSVPLATCAKRANAYRNPMPGMPHILAMYDRLRDNHYLIPVPMRCRSTLFFGTTLVNERQKLYVPCMVVDVSNTPTMCAIPYAYDVPKDGYVAIHFAD